MSLSPKIDQHLVSPYYTGAFLNTKEVVSDVYICMYRSFAHYFIVFVHVKHENPQ